MYLNWRRNWGLILVFLTLMTLGLAGCSSESWSWHQRLTLIFATPDGDVSGSAVIEVSWSEVNSVHNYPGGYRGEASVVNLGSGRYLFALLDEQTKYLAFETFNGGPGIGEKIFAAMAQFRGIKPVLPENYPLMVTFDDIKDPASVKKVDPDNLAATFGPGYSLKSVTLEITDEPVTRGEVEKVLGWLGKIKGRIKPSNKKYADELTTEEMLYRNDFIKGDK